MDQPNAQVESQESPAWPLPPTQRTIAVANQKGGVGKSTTAVNVGAWLALEGARVLVVDLDPQANATTGVGLHGRGEGPTVYEVLTGGVPAEEAMRTTAIARLVCLPSSIDLAGAEVELVATFSREMCLKSALSGLNGRFDYVLIDCPPSLGLLTVNALAAATELLVPIQCEYYALEGLGQLLRNLQLVRSGLNPALELTGIALTMYDGRTRLSEDVAAQVRAHFPGRVFASVIPRSVRLSEAPSFGQPIALYDPGSKGGTAYRALAAEVAFDALRRGRSEGRAEAESGPSPAGAAAPHPPAPPGPAETPFPAQPGPSEQETP